MLTRIGDKIKENNSLETKSYVLLDLDSTLYEVAPDHYGSSKTRRRP